MYAFFIKIVFFQKRNDSECLNCLGKTPELKDRMTMMVMVGRIVGRHCFRRMYQVSTFVLWPILVLAEKGKYDWNLIWAIPLSLSCLSVRWWENFMEKPKPYPQSDNNDGRGIRARLTQFAWRAHNAVWDVACEIYESRIQVDLILSLWKIKVADGVG